MKQLIFAILLTGLFFNTNAQAPKGHKNGHQNEHGNGAKGKTPEEKAKKFTTKLDSVVALTPPQEEKVNALVVAKVSEIKVVKDKYKSAPGDKNTNMKAAHEEIKPIKKKFNDDLKAILTPEQKTTYDAYVKKRKEQKKMNNTQPEPEEDLED